MVPHLLTPHLSFFSFSFQLRVSLPPHCPRSNLHRGTSTLTSTTSSTPASGFWPSGRTSFRDSGAGTTVGDGVGEEAGPGMARGSVQRKRRRFSLVILLYFHSSGCII